MAREEQRTAQIMEIASLHYEDCEKYSAFISGAMWSDNNPTQDIVNLNDVWHDASEEPLLEDKEIIFLNEQGISYISEKFGGTFTYMLEELSWERFVELLRINKWAYIDDLLPKQFGKTNYLKDL